ncbi:hypothetical protein EJ04DRAFT_277880 [Polyplosphaeria fusca]|uniref:Uncharacterized protein n=1 Tax=Polyplosphaeria fusca TaxID=682080 RepID=A0A9P4QVF5_9PLEO|nr:hypothetical protein EJ04DRAFT_277880 [Polyplosphaeria fusca]
MKETSIWIILAAVLGFFLLALVLTLGLFCWKRSKRRIRGFSLRAVTPLDDAEFESWRRPSQYTQRPEKYGIKPAVVRSPRAPNMWEKELGLTGSPRTPSPRSSVHSHKSPSSPLQKPEPARRKSSVSLADRPPTPYSPASTTGEFPRRGSRSRRSQGSIKYGHHPSMSQSSDITFDFNFEFESPPRSQPRPSNQSDRPLYYSYGRHGDYV